MMSSSLGPGGSTRNSTVQMHNIINPPKVANNAVPAVSVSTRCCQGKHEQDKKVSLHLCIPSIVTIGKLVTLPCSRMTYHHIMASFDNPAITPDSTVLVTGANGFVGAHVADQLLQGGYRVRGTVRDASKHQWLVERFSEKYGKDRFELITVKDMREPGAYDSAVSGVLPHGDAIVSSAPD